MTRAQVDKRLKLGRGFATRILTGKVDLKHEHILLLLKAMEVAPEDFYRILYHRPEERTNGGTLGRLLERLTPFDFEVEDKDDGEDEPEEVTPATVALDAEFAKLVAVEVAELLRKKPGNE